MPPDGAERAAVGKSLVAWLQEQAEFVRLFYTTEVVDGSFASVRSKIITRRAEVAIEYRLRQRDGRWRVYDVLMDGVSFVATYRSEFERIIQQSSWSGLMDKLRRRAIHATLVDRAPRMVSTPR